MRQVPPGPHQNGTHEQSPSIPVPELPGVFLAAHRPSGRVCRVLQSPRLNTGNGMKTASHLDETDAMFDDLIRRYVTYSKTHYWRQLRKRYPRRVAQCLAFFDGIIWALMLHKYPFLQRHL
jgi:hypothetical protein